MNPTHCPVCHTKLEVKEVAPCWDCGHMEREKEDLENEEHVYAEFRVFGHHHVILCDFCDVDFGSYLPSYFGIPDTGRVIDNSQMEFVRDLPKPWIMTKDKYCPNCDHRLAFIKFRKAILDENKTTEQNG